MVNFESLQQALQQLSQAIQWHEEWYRAFARDVVCHLAHDDVDVGEDAYCRCDFGRWYYGADVAKELRDEPDFAGLESDHRRMHFFAARLLQSATHGLPVAPDDYDNFANAIDKLHQTLYSLKRRIEEFLYGHDPLTGVENRVAMFARLRDNLELARRNVGQSCIGIVDLDRFKDVNDVHGHLVGDQVLAAAAHRILEHVRPYDKVFRYGGEEFLIAMPNAGLQAGLTMIERVRDQLAAAVLVHHEGHPISVTASCGLSLLDPDVGVEASIERADRAMYAAKAAGRNRVCVWNSSMAQPGASGQ